MAQPVTGQRKSQLQLYAPFLVLALIQGLFIAVAPSRGSDADVAAGDFSSSEAFDPANPGGSGGFEPSDPGAIDPETGEPIGDLGSSGGGGGGDGVTGGAGGTGPIGGGGGGGVAVAGDTSHCTNAGKQFGITRTGGPPCVPKWPDGADNGGATYTGVTDKSIKVVYFSSEPNAQVDAVLAPQGLAVEEEDFLEALKAYFEFVNKRFETYGRTVELVRIVGNCPTTPPNYDNCIAAAQEVVKAKPFAVIWGTSLYASVYDVWAKNGIVSLGGNHFDDRFFTQRRPYRYDVFMDGTQSADHIAEYYCKKMAKKKVSHSGQVIHATIGARNQIDRKLGIVVPEIEANVLAAQRVRSKVKACSGVNPLIRTYESNIETATQQTRATTSALIEGKVTTVVCMCDPIAPAFLTTGMSGDSYFPEFMLPGLGLLDYDLLGRLYDKNTMAHAFGPSHLGLNIALDDTDQARVWRDVGRSGHPCGKNGCGIPWAYVNTFAAAVQMAGPNLNPLTFEQSLLSTLPDSGGTPDSPLANYGPGDYTGLGDAKEVYWSETARSAIDGQPGAYIVIDNGKRIRLGGWGNSLSKIPVSPN